MHRWRQFVLSVVALGMLAGCPTVELTAEETTIDLLDSTSVNLAIHSNVSGPYAWGGVLRFTPSPVQPSGCCEWDLEVSPLTSTTYRAIATDAFAGIPLITTKSVRIVVDPDIPVTRIPFADPALEACVDGTGAVMTSELTALDCPGLGIQDLSGLEYLTYLRRVDLAGNDVTTVEPRRLAESLRANLDLDLTGSADLRCLDRALIGDLFGSAVLPGTCAGPAPLPVDDLVFSSNFFQYCWDGWNVDNDGQGGHAITYADEVERLDCEITGWPLDLGDLPELLQFRNLADLALGGFDLDGSSPPDPFADLAALPLRSLRLGSSVASAPSQASIPLELPPLPELRTLRVALDDLPDLDFLVSAPDVVTLYLDNPSVSDYGPLTQLASLDDLTIRSAGLSSISDLPVLAGLRRLSLPFNGVDDIGALPGFVSLEFLSLAYASLSDLTPVTLLPVLEELVVDAAGPAWNVPPDLATLVGAPALLRLHANGAYLETVPAALASIGLEELSLRDNQLGDLSSLAGLGVATLDLSGNYIQDLSTLGGLPAVETLRLRSGRGLVTGLDALESLPSLAVVDVYDAFGFPRPCGELADLRVARPDLRLLNDLGIDQDCGG